VVRSKWRKAAAATALSSGRRATEHEPFPVRIRDAEVGARRIAVLARTPSRQWPPDCRGAGAGQARQVRIGRFYSAQRELRRRPTLLQM
jgi:hypothetical protein